MNNPESFWRGFVAGLLVTQKYALLRHFRISAADANADAKLVKLLSAADLAVETGDRESAGKTLT